MWIMRNSPEFPHLAGSVSLSVLLCQDEGRARGYPSLGGLPYGTKAQGFSAEAMEEARRVGGEVVSAWRQAGSPHLRRAVENKQAYINAVFKQRLEQGEAA
jgi:hypothetical protein